MRNAILIGFLSLWIFSILAPPIIAMVEGGDETVMLLCHNEKEQQESGKKDSLEEKIIPNLHHQMLDSHLAEDAMPGDKYAIPSSNHIMEIPLPPPEHIV